MRCVRDVPLGWLFGSAALALLTVVSGACGGDYSPLGPSPLGLAPVAEVRILPGSATLIAGRTQQLVATLLDASGGQVTGPRAVTWSVSGSAATVSATGVVTGRSEGSATISATSGGRTGTATITVLSRSLVVRMYTRGPSANPGTDANGYLVGFQRATVRQVLRVGAQDSVTLAVSLGGTYLVTIKDLSPNCQMTSRDSLDVTIAPADADTSRVSFHMFCFPAATLSVSNGGRIYAFRTDGSYAPGQIDGEGPAWSPDGMKLAYTAERNRNFDIFVTDPDGTTQTRLTTDPGADWDPAWSADGAHLAFVSNRSGTAQIHVMNADGSAAAALTTTVAAEAPSWSPDGTRIAFAGTDADGNIAIYAMNADGSGVMAIDNGLVWSDYPAWSPDGTRIAFLGGHEGGQDWASDPPEVFVMNPDGSGVTRVSYGWSRPAWFPGTFPGFTSAVQMIAVTRAGCDGNLPEDYGERDDCSSAILFVTADGTFPRYLLGGGSEPAWRPGTP